MQTLVGIILQLLKDITLKFDRFHTISDDVLQYTWYT